MLLKTLFLFAITVFVFSASFSQSKKDTVYFDEDWSVCEKPVAEYYRVCELNKQNSIFYKGDVEDYYLNGQLEMKGHYTDDGKKEGGFVFYNKQGIVTKKGNYKTNEMNSDWLYYDQFGKLIADFIFNNSSTDFTPILIINTHGDTLLKDGNGKFVLDTRKDLPEIFPESEHYFVQGEVANKLKNGTFRYSFNLDNRKNTTIFSETYSNGKFLEARSYNEKVKYPLALLHPGNANLDKVDQFYHSNPVFGFGRDADQKVVNFLLNNSLPYIDAESESFYDNDKIIFYIVSHVLQNDLKSNLDSAVSASVFGSNPSNLYYSFYRPEHQQNNIRKINGDAVITIDTNGAIINSAFAVSLTRQEINKINYYLSAVSGLIPFMDGGQKSIANINLKFTTYIDSVNNKLFCRYLVANADSSDNSKMASLEEFGNYVQVEAKFPGGFDTWRRYLERNLNNAIPADHGAFPGNYTVTVSFLVDVDGTISDVRAENDPGYGTAEEAVRVIKKGPKWVPAIKDGKNVKYRQKQNITFMVTNF